MRGRAAPGFTNTDPDPRDQQMPEIERQSGHGGHDAPDAERERNQVAAIAPVRISRNGNTQCCVEKRKGKSRQQTHLCVAEAKFAFDRLNKNGQDLPVDEIECVNHHEQCERKMAPGMYPCGSAC